MTLYALETPEEAAEVVERFNGFHDGFVRSLMIRSRDRFEVHGPHITDIGHRVTGEFDAIVEFAHYNYGQGSQPPNRIVGASFYEVADFHVDLRNIQASEWPIKVVEFPPRGPATRFAFSIMLGKLRNGGWSTQTQTVFTFVRAHFEEALGPMPDHGG